MTEVWPYGIDRSGVSMEQFAEIVATYWQQYWVATKTGWVHHEMADFPDLLRELGLGGKQANVILAG